MTFGRVARLFAVLLVVAALWHARPPAPTARVVVVALPGAPADFLSIATASPRGTIAMPPSTSGAFFWTALLSLADDAGRRVGEGVPMLWSGDLPAVREMAVPSRIAGDSSVLPATAASFLGNSAGILVDAAELAAGRVPYPYDRALDSIASATAELAMDQWSQWIRVESPPTSDTKQPLEVAEFQILRASASAFFFSPAYVVGKASMTTRPFLGRVERELRPLVAAHVIALAKRRFEFSHDQISPVGDRRPLLLFDTVAEDVAAVFAPDSVPTVVLDQVRDAIVAEGDAVREALGEDGVMLLVGGVSTARQAGVEPWYAVVPGLAGPAGRAVSSSPVVLELTALRSMVRYLSGVSLDPREKVLLPPDFAARFPVRATIAKAAAPVALNPPAIAWSATGLESVRAAGL